MERYITDSLDEYPVGPCECGCTIARADLTRRENWDAWDGKDDHSVPLLWTADGVLTCSVCEKQRKITADVQSGAVRTVLASARVTVQPR